MAQVNKIYLFLSLCTGMAVGSTVVNRIMKPEMSIRIPQPKKSE